VSAAKKLKAQLGESAKLAAGISAAKKLWRRNSANGQRNVQLAGGSQRRKRKLASLAAWLKRYLSSSKARNSAKLANGAHQ